MNINIIREKILEVKARRDFTEIQNYFETHPDGIELLVTVLINEEDYPLKEYSSWILVHLCKSHPNLVRPFYDQFVDLLFISQDQTVLRNVVNIISHLKIKNYRESELIDVLISFIQEHRNKVALQVYSMQILALFVLKYPELKKEIVEILDLNDKDKTPAYNSGKRNFMKKTKKINLDLLN
ncbi:MAG: hypothetical protein MK105_16870 [Crocinitomicaceae bacterium]|nr:hypothetical protein [Crocinitomicaceae bacterium]